MLEVQKTEEFDEWLSSLADQKAQAKIVSALSALASAIPVMLSRSDIKRAKEIAAEL
jgi:putative component of toxin-antitoxin plasmid stabilization module